MTAPARSVREIAEELLEIERLGHPDWGLTKEETFALARFAVEMAEAAMCNDMDKPCEEIAREGGW